ncbi:MAG TPA: hypothetical protein VI112_09320 [Bacteroidia bacterium]|jgi:hypothetical protein
MKKTLLTTALVMAFVWSWADVTIQGTYSGSTVLFGTITVKCKNSQETCVKIKNAGSALNVYVPGGSPETFTASSYSTTGCDTCGEEDVTFYDCQY